MLIDALPSDLKNMQIILSKMKACVIIFKSSQKPSNTAKW